MITLRTIKGTALTYDEMDRNLSQYFFSSSLHGSGAELRLHYTGSNNLDETNVDSDSIEWEGLSIDCLIVIESNDEGDHHPIRLETTVDVLFHPESVYFGSFWYGVAILEDEEARQRRKTVLSK